MDATGLRRLYGPRSEAVGPEVEPDEAVVGARELINCSGRPWDFAANADLRTYADLVAPAGLDFVRTYADGIGACKDVLIPRDAAGNLSTPTSVLSDAHARRLGVHGWTFRRENQFLPTNYRSGPNPNAPGDMAGEITAFLTAGMDGFFTDNPEIGVEAVEAFET
jgi:glycerophosphoryl diester phosphodiesterase